MEAGLVVPQEIIVPIYVDADTVRVTVEMGGIAVLSPHSRRRVTELDAIRIDTGEYKNGYHLDNRLDLIRREDFVSIPKALAVGVGAKHIARKIYNDIGAAPFPGVYST